jgi:hypothetical protein
LDFWKHDSPKQKYAKYICSGKHNHIWEALETAMNPLKLAQTFREQGWKVNIVDMKGVADKNLDVSHVLGCDVLGVECENGWIQGLYNKTYHDHSMGEPDLSSLDAKAQLELETMFRYRDCHYQGLLDDNKVVILQDTSLSSMLKNDCDPKKHDIYSLFANTTFLYNALRTQFGCHDELIDIGELLGIQDNTTKKVKNDTSTTKNDRMGDLEVDTALEKLGKEQLVSMGAKVAVPSLLLVGVIMAGIFLLYRRMRQGVEVVDLSAFDSGEIEEPFEDGEFT